MVSIIQKFKNLFKKQKTPQEISAQLEVDSKQFEKNLKELHEKARKPYKRTKKHMTIEDFEKAQLGKQRKS